MSNAIIVPLERGDFSSGTAEVTDVYYDLWTLRITLRLSERRGLVYIDFRQVEGFRVLDEGQLLEFWDSPKVGKCFLFVVEAGGWFALESSREGFVGTPAGIKEYLVVGMNDCVSILDFGEPVVTVVE